MLDKAGMSRLLMPSVLFCLVWCHYRCHLPTARTCSGALKGRLPAAGLQEQLRRVEKDRQDLLEICQGRLAGIQNA